MAHELTNQRQLDMMSPEMKEVFSLFSPRQQEAFFSIVDIENKKTIEVTLTLTATELRAFAHLIRIRPADKFMDVNLSFEQLHEHFMAILGLSMMPHLADVIDKMSNVVPDDITIQ